MVNIVIFFVGSLCIVSSYSDNLCPSDQFLCDGNKCKMNEWRCDGLSDCIDGTDELDCPTVADSTSQSIVSTSKSPTISTTSTSKPLTDATISLTKQLHTNMSSGDNPQNNTEFSPRSNCSEVQFDCGSGDCIPETWVCDTESDCQNGRDELSCQEDSPEMFDKSASPSTPTSALLTSSTTGTTLNPLTASLTTQLQKSMSPGVPPQANHTFSLSSNCSDDQFDCGSDDCIPVTWVCDSDSDCKNGRDELNCQRAPTTMRTTSATTTTTARPICPEGSLKCKNEDKCIPETFVCNRKRDCKDFSDEINCGKRTCLSNKEFRCGLTKYCIFNSWVCDNYNDCVDGSDEANCGECTEQRNKFMCSDGLCINITSRCDSLIDCYDGSDEQNCTDIKAPAPCISSQFTCVSDGLCIKRFSRCNQIVDCVDGSDEANCNSGPCEANEVRCKESGNCILKEWLCDGYEDCLDGSDELNCTGTPRAVTNVPEINLKSNTNKKITTTNGCPKDFFSFENLCIWVNPFPRNWLRARQICSERNSHLTEVATQPQYKQKLFDILRERSLHGWNYWVGKPEATLKGSIPKKEMEIPVWFLNGRMIKGERIPMYMSDCFYLDYKDFRLYKSPECYDLAGFICETTRNNI